MLPFPTQDNKKIFPTGFVYSKKEKKKNKKKTDPNDGKPTYF